MPSPRLDWYLAPTGGLGAPSTTRVGRWREERLDELRDHRRRAGGAVRGDRERRDGPVDLLGDGGRDHVRRRHGVVHAAARAVALEAVADVAVLLEMVPQREVQERP